MKKNKEILFCIKDKFYHSNFYNYGCRLGEKGGVVSLWNTPLNCEEIFNILKDKNNEKYRKGINYFFDVERKELTVIPINIKLESKEKLTEIEKANKQEEIIKKYGLAHFSEKEPTYIDNKVFMQHSKNTDNSNKTVTIKSNVFYSLRENLDIADQESYMLPNKYWDIIFLQKKDELKFSQEIYSIIGKKQHYTYVANEKKAIIYYAENMPVNYKSFKSFKNVIIFDCFHTLDARNIFCEALTMWNNDIRKLLLKKETKSLTVRNSQVDNINDVISQKTYKGISIEENKDKKIKDIIIDKIRTDFLQISNNEKKISIKEVEKTYSKVLIENNKEEISIEKISAEDIQIKNNKKIKLKEIESNGIVELENNDIYATIDIKFSRLKMKKYTDSLYARNLVLKKISNLIITVKDGNEIELKVKKDGDCKNLKFYIYSYSDSKTQFNIDFEHTIVNSKNIFDESLSEYVVQEKSAIFNRMDNQIDMKKYMKKNNIKVIRKIIEEG